MASEVLKPDLAEPGRVQEEAPPDRKPEPTGRATFKIWRGDALRGELVPYTTTVSEGMVVLDAVHQIQAEQANDLAVRWNCKAGKCGSCSAEINGNQAPGVGSGQAIAMMEALANQHLPSSMGFEWTELTYQQVRPYARAIKQGFALAGETNARAFVDPGRHAPAGSYETTGLPLSASSFTIEAGKTTTINIKPVIYKDAAFVVNFWMPTLMASVQTDAGTSEEKALNTRSGASIAWPQYSGPLKFVAK